MIKSRRDDEPDMDQPNLTSMTDILMTLILFFMVLDTAETLYGFNINLPASISTVEQQKKVDPTIFIDYRGPGNIVVTTAAQGEKAVGEDQLKQYLAILKKQFGYKQVILQASQRVKYKYVILVMDMSRQVGLTDISLTVTEE